MKLFSINGHKVNLVGESFPAHVIDDDEENVLDKPALLCVNPEEDDASIIKCKMPGAVGGDGGEVEEIPAWVAKNYAILVVKVYAADTTAVQANIKLMN